MKINKNDVLKNINSIPSDIGIIRLIDKREQLIYITKSSNMRNTVSYLLKKADDDQDIINLFSHTNSIECEKMQTLLDALRTEKKALLFSKPEFNNIINFTRNYSYLGIDFFKVPYFKMHNSTIEKGYYYLGPFRDRFFVYDFLDAMNALFQYPVCETEEYPCELYKNGKCKGYCLEERKMIFEIILESYLTINRNKIADINKRKDILMRNLSFSEADEIAHLIKIVEKYYEYLLFLHCTKKINTTFITGTTEYTIEKGLISIITESRSSYEFPIKNIEFAENERLAEEKDSLDEAWIVYKHIAKENKEYLENIYLKSENELIENLAEN